MGVVLLFGHERARLFVARETLINEARRAERLAFPMVAVCEAIVNAVVHADYSRRGAPIRPSILQAA